MNILKKRAGNVKVGKIKNGKAQYIDRIVNVTNYKDKKNETNNIKTVCNDAYW